MAYWTAFSGALVITPALPPEFLARWNTARDGTPGRRYVRSYRPGAGGRGVVDEPDMLPGFEHVAKPQEWCHWQVIPGYSSDTGPVTLVVWDGSDNFLEYDRWLQVLIDVVERDVGPHRYEGAIQWAAEEPDDSGFLYAFAASDGWSVAEAEAE